MQNVTGSINNTTINAFHLETREDFELFKIINDAVERQMGSPIPTRNDTMPIAPDIFAGTNSQLVPVTVTKKHKAAAERYVAKAVGRANVTPLVDNADGTFTFEMRMSDYSDADTEKMLRAAARAL